MISLRELQNGRPKGCRPGEKNYNPSAGGKGSRCGNHICNKSLSTTKGHYRFVDDRTVLLCDECLEKYTKEKK